MTKLHALADLGQAVWVDYIRRDFVASGELAGLIAQGVRGVTSNPAIFERAIALSADYDADLRPLADEGRAVLEIYEALALEDIRRAADLLRPVYEQTHGGDGYVSLEVNPALAHDTPRTIAEARRLFAALKRPNVLIKVPATPAGIPAIAALIAEGINVNITLIFSLAHYRAVVEAYLSGLERRVAAGGDVSRVASVASFFVSRVDGVVDQKLEALGAPEALALRGQAAIANARVAYAAFRETLATRRWAALAARGARAQRVLWASTSTKNPAYPDTLYVDQLIGRDTVNTVPPATLQAFLDHGQVAPTLEGEIETACSRLARLANLGIDLDAVTQQLQDDGVGSFASAFEALLRSVAHKRERLATRWQSRLAILGAQREATQRALAEMGRANVIARIWQRDHTLWKPEPTEIGNRLGWLSAPETMGDKLPAMQALAETLRVEGYRDALLLGMGGSSLAPEVFSKTLGARAGYLKLAVLDSTDPGAVLAHAARLDPARSLFIVSTKSGGTVETFSLAKYFYNWAAQALGAERAGQHFVAITDPGSGLAALAARLRFRATFLNDPNVGGRYSALTTFGLLPAALMGHDVAQLLERAQVQAVICGPLVVEADNPAAWLGAALGALAGAGRDKLTFVLSPAIASLGDWLEQLIAESTGKEGRGILPVVGEPLGPPAAYGDDRVFVHLRLAGDETYAAALTALEAAGHSVLRLDMGDLADLGAQFFLWELATAVAGHLLRVNPFEQPNVEAAKSVARQMVAEYQRTGALPPAEAVPPDATRLEAFLAGAAPGDYIALQAYLQPSAETDAALGALRTHLRDRYRLAITLGYGPRFLHSTGQLHKGDAGRGLFIQFSADDPRDAPIPDEAGADASSISFGVLKAAQALGDAQSLREAGRRVLRVHLGRDILAGLLSLTGFTG